MVGDRNTVKNSALWFAESGFSVLPLHHTLEIFSTCSCSRGAKCSTPAKHPRTLNGVSDATQRLDIIERWFNKWPHANLGVITGQQSSVAVLDIDPRNGGTESLKKLESDFEALPMTPFVHTGRGDGGLHFYFETGDASVSSTNGLPGYPGLDLKGDRGYVVAPPSIHESGGTYRWDEYATLDTEARHGSIDMAPLPGWLWSLTDSGNSALLPSIYENEKVNEALYVQLLSETKVLARYERSTKGLNDTSASAVDYSLACMLAVRGAPGALIARAVRCSRSAVPDSDIEGKSRSYLAHTVGKALTFRDAASVAECERLIRTQKLLDSMTSKGAL